MIFCIRISFRAFPGQMLFTVPLLPEVPGVPRTISLFLYFSTQKREVLKIRTTFGNMTRQHLSPKGMIQSTASLMFSKIGQFFILSPLLIKFDICCFPHICPALLRPLLTWMQKAICSDYKTTSLFCQSISCCVFSACSFWVSFVRSFRL